MGGVALGEMLKGSDFNQRKAFAPLGQWGVVSASTPRGALEGGFEMSVVMPISIEATP